MNNNDRYSLIMNRLKQELDLNSDSQLASKLGMSRSALSNRKQKDSVPYDAIMDIAESSDIDVSYVLTGVKEGESRENKAKPGTIGSRIKEERELLKYSIDTFGSIGGVTEMTQERYENNESRPDADYLASIAECADVQYILTGERTIIRQTAYSILQAQMNPAKYAKKQVYTVTNRNFDILMSELYKIDKHIDKSHAVKMKAAINHIYHYATHSVHDVNDDIVTINGISSDDKNTERKQYAFDKKWIEKSELQHENLAVVKVEGASMQPLLFDSDIVLVNVADLELRDGDSYVFRIAEQLLVRSVQLLPGNKVQLCCKNPEYQPYLIDKNDLDDSVITVGRVVAATHYYN